ncbi:putative glycolipid-binding domain-containing protein [Paenibacillus sp. UMB4589-SE434]|uniref:putative glycolipid-binding domain-containing protein n=1 Tax=Paenibacillus sp. UMB4589-SE434 TaxID=3046314 RepID=UPI00254B90B4|nr:putative glycolipid-binding domain-containing protein [Paenibacillus sp. UMB4589-SE434]MDK8181070.1 putative glycolipid-binding domain-containing protein [Paenibacillus sp. UMB4589-SE434]
MCANDNGRFSVQYTVLCDQDGSTRQVEVRVQQEQGHTTLNVERDHLNRWTLNGLELSELNGIKDIDIGVTPATNLLPIQRLKLEVGQSAQFDAARIRFPELTIQPMKQQYERVGANTYIYKSIESGYTAKVYVDENGIVTDYEGEWQQV